MYSIDPRPLNIKNLTTGETVCHNPKNEKFHPSNEYDLANANIYSDSGEIIEEADLKVYDWQMALLLQRITPIYKSEDLLNHHYERTPNKELFLKHIRYHILNFLGDPKPLRKEFILKWLEEKAKQAQTNNRQYTHREYILEHRFLVEAGIKKEMTAKQMKEISSKRYNAFLSLTPKSKTAAFKEPTQGELINVVEMLSDSLDAQNLAKKALENLKQR